MLRQIGQKRRGKERKPTAAYTKYILPVKYVHKELGIRQIHKLTVPEHQVGNEPRILYWVLPPEGECHLGGFDPRQDNHGGFEK